MKKSVIKILINEISESNFYPFAVEKKADKALEKIVSGSSDFANFLRKQEVESWEAWSIASQEILRNTWIDGDDTIHSNKQYIKSSLKSWGINPRLWRKELYNMKKTNAVKTMITAFKLDGPRDKTNYELNIEFFPCTEPETCPDDE